MSGRETGYRSEVGSEIARLCREAGVRPSALAQKVGLSKYAMQRVLRDQAEPPASVVFAIERVLGIPIGTVSTRLGFGPLSHDPAVVDVATAARYLSTTVRHMRKLVYERRVTYTKIGGKLRFRLEDLDVLVEEGVVERASP